MKKFLVLILALLMALSLISCGDDAEKEPANTDAPAIEDVPQDAPILEEAPKAETPDADAPKVDAPKTETPKAEEPVFVEKLPSGKTETVVEEYFKRNAQAFLAYVTDNYAKTSGSICTGRLAAVGYTVTVDVCIGGLNDVTDESRKQLQDAYSTFGDIYSQLFEDVKAELPELETMTINLCEEDGDLLVALKHGK